MRASVATLVAVVALAGCSGSDLPSARRRSTTSTDASGAQRELAAEAKRLTLPNGARWDLHPPQLDDAGDEGAVGYGKGLGAQLAQFQWYCAWGEAVVDAEEAEERRSALGVLARFEALSVWAHLDDDGRASYRAAQASAEQGDLGPLRERLALDCL